MKKNLSLTAESNTSAESSFDPRFGWRFCQSTADSEQIVIDSLLEEFDILAYGCGTRNVSYDIVIPTENPHVEPGRYEVKSLWRRSAGSSFDRRFKLGRRGEQIYGRRDSLIKEFALCLERNLLEISQVCPAEDRDEFMASARDFINRAIERRHSKSFCERLDRLARAALAIPSMNFIGTNVLSHKIEWSDIANGFNDIMGIFIVAGPIYTLVRNDEFKNFLAFDSASSEGPKLKFTQTIPLERNKK